MQELSTSPSPDAHDDLDAPPAKASKGQRRRQKILQLLTTDLDANVSVSDLSDTSGSRWRPSAATSPTSRTAGW
ncbi:MAG: hypothetical protein R2719_13740 [Micropruina sp.]